MFPFNDDPRTACIVCNHVLNKEEPITYINLMMRMVCGSSCVVKNIRQMMQELYL